MSRRSPSKTVMLASALLKLGDIPYEHAKLMTADQIISLYEFHHNIYDAEEGSMDFWNLEPMLIAAHKKRTREIDIPQIAKNKRIRRKECDHRDKLGIVQTRWMTREECEEMFPSGPSFNEIFNPRRKARPKLRSRGFDKTKTRTLGGKVKPRKQRRK